MISATIQPQRAETASPPKHLGHLRVRLDLMLMFMLNAAKKRLRAIMTSTANSSTTGNTRPKKLQLGKQSKHCKQSSCSMDTTILAIRLMDRPTRGTMNITKLIRAVGTMTPADSIS